MKNIEKPYNSLCYTVQPTVQNDNNTIKSFQQYQSNVNSRLCGLTPKTMNTKTNQTRPIDFKFYPIKEQVRSKPHQASFHTQDYLVTLQVSLYYYAITLRYLYDEWMVHVLPIQYHESE